jgi:hypothetical protein
MPRSPTRRGSGRSASAARRVWRIAVATGYGVLLVGAIAAEREWFAVALATGAIPVFATLTGYYHVVLLGLALCHARRAWIGAAMALLAAATQAIYAGLPYSDVPFLGMSAVEIAVIVAITAGVYPRSSETSRNDVEFRSEFTPSCR